MRDRHSLPLILLLFFGSGCAALIYEIIWFQLLELAVGSSAISLGVLLGIYMGGMCLGSLLLPKYVSAKAHPLRVYAKIEAGIGAFGLLALFLIPGLNSVYAALGIAGGLGSILLRALLAALCLLPPTLLMGASLPAIARWVDATPEGVSWLGYFYGGNIAGAVCGSLLAGFYLLRVYDMAAATYAAAAINFTVAALSFLLAKRGRYTAGMLAPKPVRGIGRVYVVAAISGLCALGSEVIWTRLLALMMGATVYTFSIILAVFLAGLGIGSAAGSAIARKGTKTALGYCQVLAGAGIAWAAYSLSSALPYWPIDPTLSPQPWFNFQIDIMRALWTVLPAACFWGASFPLALAAAASEGDDAGSLTGRMYAANTVGAIIGAIGTSVMFVPWLGSQDAQRLLIALATLGALIILVPAARSVPQHWAGAGAAGLLAGVLIAGVHAVPWLAVAYGRRMLTAQSTGKPLYQGEGMNSSIVVSQLDYGAIYFHVSGKVEASTEPFDMRLQRMLGHIPALVHKGPESVLIVGFGAGVTAGTFVVHPEVKRIVICELEPLIPPATGRFFAKENHNVYTDPRTEIHFDDARHYVLTSKDKFDLITSDPIHPWVKGTATLYSREYFEMCKRHLNPGGVVTQWVPLYESDPETVKSELATFFEVFPHGTVWANNSGGMGYDVVLLGTLEDTRIDLDALEARLGRPDHAQVFASLREVGFQNGTDLFKTYAGRAEDLQPWLRDAVINGDMNLKLQYMAGMGVNFNNAAFLGEEIGKYRKFPEGLFSGTRASEMRFALAGR